jgi:nicotinamide-nucleotide amidase
MSNWESLVNVSERADFWQVQGRLIEEAAALVAEGLLSTNTSLVLAESCTAGLVASSLGTIPGISGVLCGSAVVYQIQTKAEWLGVSLETIERCGVVSSEVAREMAVGVLRRTTAADLAVSVTGHLGPAAPPELNGIVWIGWSTDRGQPDQKPIQSGLEAATTGSQRLDLTIAERQMEVTEKPFSPVELRVYRQQTVCIKVLTTILGLVNQHPANLSAG